MAANLATRLKALEKKISPKLSPLIVAGPMEEDEDPTPHIERAKRVWAENHGRDLPADARMLCIVLIGCKPGEAHHAR